MRAYRAVIIIFAESGLLAGDLAAWLVNVVFRLSGSTSLSGVELALAVSRPAGAPGCAETAAHVWSAQLETTCPRQAVDSQAALF